jgi:Holliday junction resolvase-like predicted endonuclease
MDLLPAEDWVRWALLVSVAILAGLIAWLALAIRRAWKAWLLTRRMSTAATGEEIAERWLAARGHRVLERQLTRRAKIWVDGAAVPFDVRADLLVQMGDSRVIVEVKTGDAADPCAPLTRRQLREYADVFNVERVFLFDATNQRLLTIEFPQATEVDPAEALREE